MPSLPNLVPGDLHVRPPEGLIPRLRHYVSRYGWIHALASYLGRHWFSFWRWVGPWVTRNHRKQWISAPGPHILNLGGGSVLNERWLTADMDPRSDVWTDITQPLPFPDASVDIVYLEEVIEHISRPLGASLLIECLRILKPGGTLRLTTPSLDYFVGLPLDNESSVREINDIFNLHGHRHIYSEWEMQHLLITTGFSKVAKSSYRDPDARCGEFDSHPERFPEAVAECSQYWEASK